jgi:lysozyme family protein|tara:strand:- start:614 stop:1126 length:513 start_codon:yes stop_codon:yes gene_type:complete
MQENFDKCLEMLLHHEGGFVNHPRDPGGMTNFGVTRMVYEKWVGRKMSEQDMRDLTPADVAPIYKNEYWKRCKCDDLPSGVDWCVFDWAVNSGVGRSAKALQGIIGATQDGGIGPMTLKLIAEHEPRELIEKMHDKRQGFYEGLKTFDSFGKGWTRRNKETRESALELLK